MFREIRTSERITEQDARRNERLMQILDKRISDETIEELNNLEKEAEAAFDPDKRIVWG